MENVSNITSEEELLQLRNEGKISENEYEELRETLQKTTKVDIGEGGRDNLKPTRTSGLAIASLVLSLLIPSGCIPAIVCGHIALRKIKKGPALQGRGLALAGLIIGYIFLGPFLLVLFGVGAGLIGKMTSVTIEEQVAIEVTELKHYPLDNTEGVLTQSGVSLDRQISSDGNGSLRIEATEPTTVRLFETGDIDIEDARLIYQARVRTENVEGQVYLETWCRFSSVGFPGIAESFSKGLANSLSGTTDWTRQETPFLLKKGENPDNVKLNLVIEGTGTVWIDDVRLLKGPLKY